VRRIHAVGEIARSLKELASIDNSRIQHELPCR
jgi:hypothetical protein